MKISITAICKNEEKFVQSWYDALKNEVDYITVLDTGSTDNTYNLLKNIAKNDPRVIVKKKIITPWSFGDARNEAMKLLPKDTDVFVSIDLDETFKPGFGQVIRDNWTPATMQATYKYAWNHNEDGSPLHTFTYSKICKNDGKWEWKYPIHECLIRKDEEGVKYPEEALINLTDKILLDHWQDKNVDRNSYLDLLKVRWETYKGDMDAVYYARECAFHRKFEEAITTFDIVVAKEEKVNLRQFERGYINYMRGMCLYALNRIPEAMDSMKKAIEIAPEYRDPYMDLARIYMDRKEYGQAIWLLRKCLTTTRRHFDWVEVGNVWGHTPYEYLAVSCFNSGDKKGGLVAMSKAVALAPENKPLKENFDKIVASLENTDF